MLKGLVPILRADEGLDRTVIYEGLEVVGMTSLRKSRSTRAEQEEQAMIDEFNRSCPHAFSELLIVRIWTKYY